MAVPKFVGQLIDTCIKFSSSKHPEETESEAKAALNSEILQTVHAYLSEKYEKRNQL